MLGSSPECFLTQFMEELAAENSDCEQAAEEEDGIDTAASLALPIDVFEVEPEREFIEREARSDTVEKRQNAAHGPRMPRRLPQPAISDEQQEKDAPD